MGGWTAAASGNAQCEASRGDGYQQEGRTESRVCESRQGRTGTAAGGAEATWLWLHRGGGPVNWPAACDGCSSGCGCGDGSDDDDRSMAHDAACSVVAAARAEQPRRHCCCAHVWTVSLLRSRASTQRTRPAHGAGQALRSFGGRKGAEKKEGEEGRGRRKGKGRREGPLLCLRSSVLFALRSLPDMRAAPRTCLC